MTFLNPFVLFGLFAAAIPILIHLLNKRKLRTIDFSTLTFLKELQKNKMRKITIRQWLLLILRTLLIMFLVIAFSRPALKGNFGSIGSHATSTIVIIVDNTASMDLHNEKGRYLDQAKEHAQQIVGLMNTNDEAVLIRLSDLPAMTTPQPTHDRQKLQSLIQETSISLNRRTIEEGFRLAGSVLQQSRNANKEIHILTDGQSSTFREGEAKQPAPETIFSPGVKLFVTRLAESPVDNAGIEQVSITSALLQAKKPLTMNAVVRNFGSQRLENHMVSVSLGSKRVMQKSVTLEPGERGTVEFTLIPEQTGFLEGNIELEDDNFEADNKRFFALYIPGQARVALISPGESASRYIVTALEVANTLSPSGMVTLQQVAPAQISTSVLNATDVIILSGVKEMPLSQQRMVQQYVEQGGTMLFFPSADSTGTDYSYLKPLSIPIAGIVKAPPQTSYQFGKSDFDFPIFSGMFEKQQKKDRVLESPVIFQALHIPQHKSMQEIISLTTGTPFLWLREVHKGKVLGFSVPAYGQWSDFPLKGIFVPMLYQSVLYLSSQEQLTAVSKEYVAGEPVELTASQLRKTRQPTALSYRLVDPEHRPSPLQTYTRTSAEGVTQTMLTGPELHVPGHHYVLADRDTVGALAVNVNKAESDNQLFENSSMTEFCTALGIDSGSVTFVSPDASVAEVVKEARFGMELWRYCALLAILAGLAEMIIAREKKTL